MDAYPFCVFKRKDRPCFLVKFKDEAGNYLPPVSTKKNTRDEALQVAFKWLRDGIPQKKSALRVTDLSLKDMVRKIKTGDEVETIQDELRRLGWVKSYVRKDTPGATDLISFLTTFWDWDTSPYIEEKLRQNHGIHRRHCKLQKQAIALYWKPVFEGRLLGEITYKDIDEFIKHMAKKDLSAARKNVVIKAGTKPLRWAFSKGDIEHDPTREHILFSGDERKRSILTPAVAAAIFRTVWKDDRLKIANMLASVTGMRNGEIVALRFQDLGSDCLYVNNSWNGEDKLKLPKNNETRTVEIPFPDLMNVLIEQAKQNPWGVSPNSFVFWSTVRQDVPMRGQYFVNGLREALVNIGFSKDEAGKGERPPAFSAFCAFRGLGAERNIRKAVATVEKDAQAQAKKYHVWRNWSTQFRWRERAADYDRYMEQLKQAELRKTIEAQGEMHRAVTGKMLEVVKKKLDTMNPAELTQNNVSEWAQTAIKAERAVTIWAAAMRSSISGEGNLFCCSIWLI